MRGYLDGSLHLKPREYPQEIPLQPHPKLNREHKCILCRLVRGLVPRPPEAIQQKLFSPEESLGPLNRRYFLKFRAEDTASRVSEVNLNSLGLVFDCQHQFYGSVYPPRSYSKDILNDLDPEKLRLWVSKCEAGHSESESVSEVLHAIRHHPIVGLKSPESNYQAGSARTVTFSGVQEPSVDLTLIDVIDECLVRGSSKDRYLALSYVWGGVQTVKLFTSNRTSLEAR
ncbi:hypothetical protein BDV96DRAFT_329151 [Lophiotrema nucula]|uniref:Heterokaryon incompatibility domain-containing protein n=1 Tax=Lophiotrema nucula TaxID=690887 RepID=A0A6A5YHI1_9PLEO|nr:hypothetical protein BDV96DRAFT_329151 [Lophiotrema nucula]